MTLLDPTRFDGMTEAEILRRIGALLGTALMRGGHLRAKQDGTRPAPGDRSATRVEAHQLIADPLERQIADYLRITGAAGPAELKRALGVSGRSLTRALARLRSGGLCEVAGRTRAARYRLRRDFTHN
jgi:DNA-binding transcriptional ArsR family regulator